MELDGIAQWAVDLMERFGGPGAALAIAAENLFPPLPSEVVLLLAGFTVSRGEFGFVAAVLWTTLGSLVGAVALYSLGALLGRDRMRWLATKVPLVETEDVDRSEAFFIRHGGKAVFFGRMIPIFRSLISIPAGIERMSLVRFGLLTTAGSAIWNTVFITAGFFLGENWHIVERYADIFQKIVIAAVLLLLVIFVVRRVRTRMRRRATRASGDTADTGEPSDPSKTGTS